MSTIGVIGAGGIANMHVPGWTSMGYSVLVYSDDNQAPILAERYGVRSVDSIEELLGEAEIVDICTPTFTHRSIAEQAAAAGRHIICEKPLALTVNDCEAIISACAKAGVRIFPAHVVRYFRAYDAAREAIRRGELGPVAIQRFSRVSAMPTKPWFGQERDSGGIVLDQMIHDFDFARWVAGPVVSVFATKRTVGLPSSRTTAQVILQHASGTITQVHGLWGSPGTQFRTRYEMAGPNGLLQHDSADSPTLVVDGSVSRNHAGYLPSAPAEESPYAAELKDFADAIHGGTAARVSAEDGLEAVRIATAVNESIRTNSLVMLKEPK